VAIISSCSRPGTRCRLLDPCPRFNDAASWSCSHHLSIDIKCQVAATAMFWTWGFVATNLICSKSAVPSLSSLSNRMESDNYSSGIRSTSCRYFAGNVHRRAVVSPLCGRQSSPIWLVAGGLARPVPLEHLLIKCLELFFPLRMVSALYRVMN
jgi:hypothetical protein